MANLTNDRISAEVLAAAEQQVKDGIQMIQNALPFLIGLTPAERINLPKINVSNKVFTEDAINAAVNNAALIPPFVKVDEMARDLALFQKLDAIGGMLQQVVEKVSDTQLLAGSEAYASALMVYKLLGAASAAGFEGAKSSYGQLRERFKQVSAAAASSSSPQ
ncbi:MAG: hypothetical protein BGN96_09930 [Bacteroidales bacterium 45-6]|nr:MAG: hypothetical protein BGN96_09930 [Bacteroidales bacterium 45-6]